MAKIAITIPFQRVKGGLLLWTQTRQEDGPLNGLEEFPGGKIEVGETPTQAACREYMEEVGVELEACDIELFGMHHHQYDDRNVILYIHSLEVGDNKAIISGLSEQKIAFESLENEVERAMFPQANKEFLKTFVKFYQKQAGI
jgi:8-oxo-dGTP diphosphatase